MKILFTTSESYFSKLIRKVTKESVSHVAIELPVGIVIHSNFRGLHIQSSKTFRKKNKIVYEFELPYARDTEDRMERTLSKFEFSLYDVGAMLFIATSLTLRTYLGIPLPKHNLWQSTGMFICTEWVTGVVFGEEDAMITPYQLYLKLVQYQLPL